MLKHTSGFRSDEYVPSPCRKYRSDLMSRAENSREVLLVGKFSSQFFQAAISGSLSFLPRVGTRSWDLLTEG